MDHDLDSFEHQQQKLVFHHQQQQQSGLPDCMAHTDLYFIYFWQSAVSDFWEEPGIQASAEADAEDGNPV